MLTDIVKGVTGMVGMKPQEDPPGHEVTPGPVDDSVARAVAAEVQAVIQSAQDAAGRIVADARQEAAKIVADARREAGVIKDAARREEPEAAPTVETPSSVPALSDPQAEPDEPPVNAEAGVEEPPGGADAEGAGEWDAPDDAAVRLVAMNMAFGGSSKAEIATHVTSEFGPVPGLDQLLDEILARTA